MHHADSIGTLASQSWINLAGFFLVIFLVGQGLVVWSFLAGHFGAWALGQIGITIGATVTFWLLIRKIATLADQNRIVASRLIKLQHQSDASGETLHGDRHRRTKFHPGDRVGQRES